MIMIMKYLNNVTLKNMFHPWTYQLLSFSVAVLSLLWWRSFEQFAIVSHEGIGVTVRPSAVDGGTGGGHLSIEIASKDKNIKI